MGLNWIFDDTTARLWDLQDLGSSPRVLLGHTDRDILQ